MRSTRNRNTTRPRRGARGLLWISAALCVLILDSAVAQYGNYPTPSPASRPAPAAPPGPNMAGGTFWLNPYANSTARAPSPQPLRNTSSYFGGSAASNPMASRPVQKPFSNYQRPNPLITSRGAAQLEVARTLWYY